jgi:spore germination protein YaaH
MNLKLVKNNHAPIYVDQYGYKRLGSSVTVVKEITAKSNSLFFDEDAFHRVEIDFDDYDKTDTQVWYEFTTSDGRNMRVVFEIARSFFKMYCGNNPFMTLVLQQTNIEEVK